MKNVLVTGAGRGLGFSLIQEFHASEFYIYAVVRTSSAKKYLLSELSNISVLVADVTDADYTERLAKFLATVSLDVLINNAGSAGTLGLTTRSSTPDQLMYEFNTHCIGALSTVKGALNSLKRGYSAIVINISSRRGSLYKQSQKPEEGTKCPFSYKIAKAAQNMLSLCLAEDLKRFGIKVLAVHPGALLTRMGQADANLLPRHSAKLLNQLISEPEFKTGEFICLETGKLKW